MCILRTCRKQGVDQVAGTWLFLLRPCSAGHPGALLLQAPPHPHVVVASHSACEDAERKLFILVFPVALPQEQGYLLPEQGVGCLKVKASLGSASCCAGGILKGQRHRD